MTDWVTIVWRMKRTAEGRDANQVVHECKAISKVNDKWDDAGLAYVELLAAGRLGDE